MNCNIFASPDFERDLKKLSKRYKSMKEDFKCFLEELKVDPFIGTDLGHNVRKIRMAIQSKNKGKSGGARVITHNVIIQTDGVNVTLLTIYDKSEQESISDKEIQKLIKDNNL
ncbi:MAG: addiction module toxin RelE [Bacteroidales bacterium]|nr:addiction module toxin RelE [Bacteroidales bacterium]